MMTSWEILGIEPTADEREIRRAYAKKLKVTRPDEDAEAYQALREAFDSALKIAPYLQQQDDEELEFSFEKEELAEVFAENLDNSNHEMIISEDSFIEESSESLNQISSDYSNEEEHYYSNYNDAISILVEINLILNEKGESGLITCWDNLKGKIANIPLEQSGFLSWNMCQFLYQENIQQPMLWSLWNGYWQWMQDYSFIQELDFEKYELLEEKVKFGNLMMFPETGSIDNDPIVTAAIFKRLYNGLSKFLSFIYVLILYPWADRESSSQDYQYFFKGIVYFNRTVNNILSCAGVVRYFIDFIIFLFLIILLFKFGNAEALGNYTLSYIFTLCIFSFMFLGLTKIIGVALVKFIYSLFGKISSIFLGLIVPAVMICILITTNSEIPRDYYFQAFLLLFVIWVVFNLHNMQYSFLVSVSVFGIVINPLSMDAEADHLLLHFLIGVLWMNANLYTYIYHPNLLRKWFIMSKNTVFFKRKNYPLKWMLNVIFSFLVGLFFIPTNIAVFYQSTKSIFLLIEIIMISLLLVFIGSIYTSYALWLFYPVVLCLTVWQFILSKWAFRKLGIPQYD